MTRRVLFVASLHHPEQLQRDRATTTPDQAVPLFPTSMGQHCWERAMRRRAYTLDVFWRNLPAFGPQSIDRLKAEVHTRNLTPERILRGIMNRLPPQINPDYRRRNAALIARARDFQPDILWLVGDNRIIYPETLAQIKADTGCLLIYATGTSPIVFSHPIERQAARLYDHVLVNDYYHGIQWLELGAKHMTCLPLAAIDPDFHHPPPDLTPDERQKYASDVTFVGTLLPHNLYSERIAALEALSEFDRGIWSVHHVPESLRGSLRGYALGAQMMRILSASRISLNVHGDFMRYGGNMRLFEAAAMNAFQIVDDRPGVSTWFTPGEHLVTFSDHADLREKVAYYLAHPAQRQQIADSAREHVLAHHTCDHRLTALENALANHKTPEEPSGSPGDKDKS